MKLTTEDGLLLKGTRLIVPTSQRQDLLRQIHAGHLGLSKYSHRPNRLHWTRLNDQIHELVINHQTCVKFFNNNHKLLPSRQLGHEVLLVPWTNCTTNIINNYILLGWIFHNDEKCSAE